MKIFRLIIALIISFIVVAIVYALFWLLMYWIIDFSRFWMIFTLFVLYGMIWNIIGKISKKTILFLKRFTYSYSSGFLFISIFSIGFGVWEIYKSWSMDIEYNSNIVLTAIMFTILLVEITLSFIFNGAEVTRNEV